MRPTIASLRADEMVSGPVRNMWLLTLLVVDAQPAGVRLDVGAEEQTTA